MVAFIQLFFFLLYTRYSLNFTNAQQSVLGAMEMYKRGVSTLVVNADDDYVVPTQTIAVTYQVLKGLIVLHYSLFFFFKPKFALFARLQTLLNRIKQGNVEKSGDKKITAN